jgi:hypothetical protein
VQGLADILHVGGPERPHVEKAQMRWEPLGLGCPQREGDDGDAERLRVRGDGDRLIRQGRVKKYSVWLLIEYAHGI